MRFVHVLATFALVFGVGLLGKALGWSGTSTAYVTAGIWAVLLMVYLGASEPHRPAARRDDAPPPDLG
ncbi:MAG: hypothetical protein M3320_06970 [Actinomycetota bacterium]|nr:hypothetical protein [Actinomycetota bacterium]